MLERLTDENLRQIVTQAVHRVTQHSETGPNAPIRTAPQTVNTDNASSPPPSSPTVVSSQDVPVLSQDSLPAPTGHLFPSFPHLTPKILTSLVSLSSGDARTALSLLELVLAAGSDAASDPEKLLTTLRRSVSTSYDRTGDDRYDMISALHKSVRGSNGSAAMYWLARMLSQGEDPVYIARRMAVCASEDVGLADNHALPLVRLLPLSILEPLRSDKSGNL